MSVRTYNPSVRVGNWNEDIQLEEVGLITINQSNFYSNNIPGEARLSGATAKSVFNSKIEDN